MKKLYLPLLAVLSPACIWADPVDLAKAKEIAAAYMHNENTPEPVGTPSLKRGASGENAPLYIFNRGQSQGFVVISGDDCLPTVLGYTEQGDYDPATLPPALLAWLEGYSQIVEQAQAKGLSARPLAAASDKKNIAPLVTAHWSQGAPYNNLCPFLTNGGGRALTGCVATAAAQVLYYWRNELPDRTQYDTPTYGYGDAPVTESIPAGTPLQWELMRDSYDGSTPEDMNTAVATLMSVTGTSTWLTYGSSTSGQISDLVNTFSGQFLLDSRCTYKSGISQSDWEDMIYEDLEKGWPIVYSGVSPSAGGHAVVVDGYRAADNLFHFNFGWGGTGDGYFTVDDATGMNGFNTWQGMTHTIHPRTLAVEGSIRKKDLYSRMTNTIEVDVTNHGTTDYKGVYIAITRSSNPPSGISDALLMDVSTIIPSGESASFTFNYRPTMDGTNHAYLMDANSRVLAHEELETYLQSPALKLDSIRLKAAHETAEEKVTVNGSESTITYNKVYADQAGATVTITNTDGGTTTTPTLRCALYRYDAGQEAFIKTANLTDSKTPFGEGETLTVGFDFGELDQDALYAIQLERAYKAGGKDYLLTAAPTDTVAYFKLCGCDLAMEETDNRGAVFTGHWNEERFAELAAASNALYYDLTQVEGLRSQPVTDNPNALFYLNADSEVKGTNLIKDGVCEELHLTAGYDFYAPDDFTARQAIFNPQTTSMEWTCIVLPFDCNVPAGSRARRIGKFTNILISESDEVNTVLKGCTPYLYRTTQPGADRITASDVNVSLNTTPECSDSIRGTFCNLEATEGMRVLDSEGHTFVEQTGRIIPAFSGYLAYDKNVSTTIYAYQRKDKESGELGEVLQQAWTLAATSADRLSADDLDTFLAQIQEAASCFTLHPDEETLEQATEQLEADIKECRRNLIPTPESPVDLSDVYLVNPSFEERTTGWDIERESGQSSRVIDVSSLSNYMVNADGSYVFYASSSSGAGCVTLSQEATGLTDGYYRLSAWLATDGGESVTLFAGDSTAVMTDDGFGKRYMRETVIDSIVVSGGTLSVGVRSNGSWYKADNFRLYYLGTDDTTPVRSVHQATPAVEARGATGALLLLGPADRTVSVTVYSADGRAVRQVEVCGQTLVGGLTKSLYIVERQKVIVR